MAKKKAPHKTPKPKKEAPEKAPQEVTEKKVSVSVANLIALKDRAILRPEEIKIGYFEASKKTIEKVFEFVAGIAYEGHECFLWGIRTVENERVVFGVVSVLDPKGNVIQNVRVVEA